MKFTLIAEHDSGEKITYEFEKEFLNDVVGDFDLFLRGCGFVFKGSLGFNNDDLQTDSLQFDLNSCDNMASPWAFDTKDNYAY